MTGVIDLGEAGRYYLEVRDGSDSDEAEQPYTLATAFTPTADAAEPRRQYLRLPIRTCVR